MQAMLDFYGRLRSGRRHSGGGGCDRRIGEAAVFRVGEPYATVWQTFLLIGGERSGGLGEDGRRIGDGTQLFFKYPV
jgi:hypothetical protein